MRKAHWFFIVLLVVLVFAPDMGSNYVVRVGTTILMYAALTIGWNLIGGFSGYPFFGAAGFFGLGAYSGALIQAQGVPTELSWVFAALFGLLAAVLLGSVLLRLRGHIFAIATLVVAEVLREVATAWTDLTGGGMGLNMPYQDISPEAAANYFYYCMLVLAVCAWVLSALVYKSKLGFGLRCIRQNEDAASMVGVNTTLYKISAFALSGTVIAATGAIYASWTGYIEPADVFDIMISIKAIVMTLLGGVGTLFGPVLGVLVFMIMDEIVWSSLLHFHIGALGVLIVLLALFLPLGLTSISLGRQRGGSQ